MPGLVEGAPELLAELAAAGVPLYAITNFSGAKWAETRSRFPFLASVFRDVVVSGDEGLVKPDPEIYRRCLARNGLAADRAIFIDDSPANVAAAAALGIDAIRFTTTAALRDDLADAACSPPSGNRLTSRNAPVPVLGEAADLRDRHRRGQERRQRRLERGAHRRPRLRLQRPGQRQVEPEAPEHVGIAPAPQVLLLDRVEPGRAAAAPSPPPPPARGTRRAR